MSYVCDLSAVGDVCTQSFRPHSAGSQCGDQAVDKMYDKMGWRIRWKWFCFTFNCQTLMNATWSIMVAVCMSATTYRAITAALVTMDSIWLTMDITVWVTSFFMVSVCVCVIETLNHMCVWSFLKLTQTDFSSALSAKLLIEAIFVFFLCSNLNHFWNVYVWNSTKSIKSHFSFLSISWFCSVHGCHQ